jgi:rubrerythrin
MRQQEKSKEVQKVKKIKGAYMPSGKNKAVIGPVEALRLALSKEIEAIKTYEKFSLDYTVAKDTFIYLMNEEQKHKALLEKKIAEYTK